LTVKTIQTGRSLNSDNSVGIHTQRDLAALLVIRESYPDATLTDIDYE